MTLDPLAVLAVPCLSDNYAYLLCFGDEALVIDPSEEEPVLQALDGRRLVGVWCTHHHWDHIGGVPALQARFGAPVVGSRVDLDRGLIEGQSQGVSDGEVLRTGPFEARVHSIPGHTLGAVAFELEGHIFTGDTLFAGGCGRVFEGTMPMMRQSLARLAALDGALRVWSGHEYTVKNLEFALELAPEPAVAARLRSVRERRAAGAHTMGEPLSLERETNPFLRWAAPAVAAAAARLGADPADPDAVFTAWREAKNRW